MGSLAEFVLGRDACGKKAEQAKQQRWGSEQAGRKVGSLQEPGERDFSP